MQNNNDNNQRILSYSTSYKLSEEELKEISGGDHMSYGPSVSGSHNPHESDVHADWKLDF